MSMKKYGLLFGAFLLGCLVVFGTNQAFGQVMCPQCPVAVVATTTPTVERTWVVRPRVAVTSTVVATPTVAQQRVFFAPRTAAPTMVFTQAQAPTYAVTAAPREPVVVRGVFTDRVRVPRGRTLTVTPL